VLSPIGTRNHSLGKNYTSKYSTVSELNTKALNISLKSRSSQSNSWNIEQEDIRDRRDHQSNSISTTSCVRVIIEEHLHEPFATS
jgi:hypothetical protein